MFRLTIFRRSTWSLPSGEFFTEYAKAIDLGKLLAHFGFVIDSPEILDKYHRRGDETIITALQRRRD